MAITYNLLNAKLAAKLDEQYGIENSLIEMNPGKVLVPPKFQEYGQQILDFCVREDDVWLVCYPRSGSTWLQEMIWLIRNDFDFEKAKSAIQQERFPYLELSAIMVNHFDSFMEAFGNSVEKIANLKSPRCIKTHVPITQLPQQMRHIKPKIISILRDPKDLCVSYYHYLKLVHKLNTDFETFCEMFLNGEIPWGSYWNHVLGYWNNRKDFDILFLRYEDLKTNLRDNIIKVSEFLDKKITCDQIDELENFLSFKNMKMNPSVNLESILKESTRNRTENDGFIRKGEIGDWKNFMNDELAAKFDKWIKENTSGTGLQF